MRLPSLPSDVVRHVREKKNLFTLCLFLFTWSVVFLYPGVSNTSDFQFHYWLSKGICLEGYPPLYCTDYHWVSHILNFPNELCLFVFYSAILFFTPLFFLKDAKQGLAYFAFGSSWVLLFNATFAQIWAVPILWLFITTNDPTVRVLTIGLARFFHKYLSYYLLGYLLINFILTLKDLLTQHFGLFSKTPPTKLQMANSLKLIRKFKPGFNP